MSETSTPVLATQDSRPLIGGSEPITDQTGFLH